MRLIRAAGQNVSPSDDGRLYDQIFSNGLFTDTAFAALGTNNVQVGAMYGDLCGRDFTIEQQTIAVPLPEGDGETTGYIYVEIDTSAETPLSVGATLAPFTPTYEDINVNGAVAQMIVAEYTASAVAVTSVTATYTKAAAGAVRPGSIATVESSPVTTNHAVGDFILYGGTVYRVTAAIATGETIVPGTNVIADSIGDTLSTLTTGLNNIVTGEERSCTISLASTGWKTGEITTPSKTGYTLVGYLLRCNTYRITSTSYQISGANTTINAYVNSTQSSNGNVFAVPIFVKN